MSNRSKLPRAAPPNKKARSAAPKLRDKLSRLVKRPDAIVCDPSKLANAPTLDEAAWRREWDKRLK